MVSVNLAIFGHVLMLPNVLAIKHFGTLIGAIQKFAIPGENLQLVLELKLFGLGQQQLTLSLHLIMPQPTQNLT